MCEVGLRIGKTEHVESALHSLCQASGRRIIAVHKKKLNQKPETAGCWWLTPVILATQEAEIRRITV
jgi:hypothetical protein